ncbi:YIP1 family protein [Sphingobium sp. SCG-1]|uniref:Yip1 family protein n=1 Tax=Sphingobium sp. SCG-1 TaxID=2072936 RepID=UPI000CD676C8|nr:Yip1 family protein [Sphingobium sp. SCG-1]AUW58471.1 YIP1 family protein [Sphingobium sp. SCG-1]
MTPEIPTPASTSLVDRVKAIILTPKEEWPRIDAEPATISGLFTGYALILAAIPALAGLIGALIFGYGALGVYFRPSIGSAISMAVVQYVLSLVGVTVIAFIIDALAPKFGGISNRTQAFKVAIYSYTASWIAGIFAIIPALSFLMLLGVYSLYLLYTGLPLLMKAPKEKAGSYTAVTVLVAVVVSLIIGAIVVPLSGMFGGSPYGALSSSSGTTEGEVSIPGVGTIDLAKMEAASKKMEAAAKQMEDTAKTGKSNAVAPSVLQAMLPASIGRYQRTEIQSAGLGAGGSNASARYEAGEHSFRVELTDMAAMGALAGLGAAMNVESNKQTATGYERTSTANGQIVTEEWDKSSGEGKYGTTVNNRFMIEASGNAASIDELKAAVAAVGTEKLAALSK